MRTGITSDTSSTTRREFLCAGALAGAGLIVGGCSADRRPGDSAGVATSAGAQDSAGAHSGPADVTIRIAPVLVELAPHHVISTVGYNGSVPAPVIRLREGRPVSVELINETDTPELVHWHGLFVPVLVELAPLHVISTVGYNGSVPAPVIRLREGRPVSVELINETDTPELVHWHGQ